MKFLVLALCVCTASAASLGYTPLQPTQQAKAVATAVVTAPEVIAKAAIEPVKSTIVEPIKPVPVSSYVPQVKSVVKPIKPVIDVPEVKSTIDEPVKLVVDIPEVQSAIVEPAKLVVDVPEVKSAIDEPVKPVIDVPVVRSGFVESVKSVVYDPVANSAIYVNKDANAAIVRYDTEVAADGFNYAYETANGISAHSSGALKKVDNSDILAIQGQYRYTSPDGTPVEFSYIADENGYQPQSNVLPVGPAIPEAIIRSLEYIRNHPQVVVQN